MVNMVATASDAIFKLLKNEEDADIILKKGEAARKRRAGRQGHRRRRLRRGSQELVLEKDQVLLIETTDGSSTELSLPPGSRISLRSLEIKLPEQEEEEPGLSRKR